MVRFSKMQLIIITVIIACIASIITNLIIAYKPGPTGHDIRYGNVTVNISGVLGAEFITGLNVTDFGQKSVNPGGIVVINTTNPNATHMVVRNIGNTNADIKINMSAAANTFFGTSSTGSVQMMSSDNQSGSCSAGLNASFTSNISTASAGSLVCTTLQFDEATDEVNVEYQLVIPSDATAGQKVEIIYLIVS